MNRQEIKDKLYGLLDEVGAVEIGEDGNRTALGDMDSIQLISLIVELEECFGVEIPDEYLVADFFENEEHVVEVIEQLVREKAISTDV